MQLLFVRLMWLFLWLCSGVVAAGVSSFEESIRRNWSTEEGLPQISITDIAQDKQGFLWLTTEGGLVRFDGLQFIAFDGSHTPLLQNPLLRAVVVEQDNSILFASTTKLIKYQNQSFTEITYQQQSIEGINVITTNHNNDILIGGEALYLFKDQMLTKLTEYHGQVSSLLTYGDAVYIGGINQLAIYQQGVLKQIPVQWPNERLTINRIAVYQQQLYIGTNQGLYLVDENGRLSKNLFGEHSIDTEILKLYVDQRQNFWIATYDELIRINDKKIFERIKRTQNASVEWVVSAFEDEDGNLWFGSKSNGLTRLRQDSTRNYGMKQGLADPFVWSLMVADDRLFVGHNQGVAEFTQDEQFVSIPIKGELPNKVVYSMFRDSQQRWWLGTRSGLVRGVKTEAGIEIEEQFPALANTQINGLVEDNQQQIWIASYDGLYRYANGQLIDMHQKNEFDNRKIRFVFLDSRQILWVGTERGLYKKVSEHFELVGDEQLKLSHITFIGETSDKSQLIVGTFQSGFAFLNDQQLTWFSPEKGIPAKTALHVQDIHKALIVSSTDGIYLLPETSLANGAELMPHIILQDKGGSARVDSYRCCNGAGNGKGAFWRDRIWYPTLAGIVSVNTNNLSSESKLPRPVFDGLYAGNTRYQALNNQLPVNARDWRIDFTAPIFYRASALVFRYKLLGYDLDWQEVDTRRQAFYTNLPPGNYEFLVQSRYSGEQQWSQPLRISISLEAYWYERLWLKILAVMGIVALIYAFYLLRVKQLAHAKAKLEQMVEARTKELELSNQQLAELNHKLEQASHTDTLTSLHNRRYLNNWLDLVNQPYAKNTGTLQIILIDLDNFKQINDTYGHLVGDEILVAMAKLLTQEVRATDHVVRWGGEEFLVIQENSLSAKEFVTRLQRKISLHQWPHQEHMKQPVRCSIGVVQHPPAELAHWNWDATLTLADKALYLVKTHGKAGWLQLIPTEQAPLNLSQEMALYSEIELAKTAWFKLEGSTEILDAIQANLDRMSK